MKYSAVVQAAETEKNEFTSRPPAAYLHSFLFRVGPGPSSWLALPCYTYYGHEINSHWESGEEEEYETLLPFLFLSPPFLHVPTTVPDLSWGLGTRAAAAEAAAARGWNEFPGIARAPQKWEGRDEKEGRGGRRLEWKRNIKSEPN